MMKEFPVTVEMLGTIGGIAVLCVLLMQWLKKFVGEWRFVPLVTLVLAEMISVIVALIQAPVPTPENFLVAVGVGFFGASVAVFGYENITNIRGMFGKGSRAPANIAVCAVETINAAGESDDVLQAVLRASVGRPWMAELAQLVKKGHLK